MQSALEQIQEADINQSALDYIEEKSTDEYLEDSLDSTTKYPLISEMTDEEYADPGVGKENTTSFSKTKNQ